MPEPRESRHAILHAFADYVDKAVHAALAKVYGHSTPNPNVTAQLADARVELTKQVDVLTGHTLPADAQIELQTNGELQTAADADAADTVKARALSESQVEEQNGGESIESANKRLAEADAAARATERARQPNPAEREKTPHDAPRDEVKPLVDPEPTT